MKKILLSLLITAFALTVSAEDGHQLWLRYQPVNKAKVHCDSTLWTTYVSNTLPAML